MVKHMYEIEALITGFEEELQDTADPVCRKVIRDKLKYYRKLVKDRLEIGGNYQQPKVRNRALRAGRLYIRNKN